MNLHSRVWLNRPRRLRDVIVSVETSITFHARSVSSGWIPERELKRREKSDRRETDWFWVTVEGWVRLKGIQPRRALFSWLLKLSLRSIMPHFSQEKPKMRQFGPARLRGWLMPALFISFRQLQRKKSTSPDRPWAKGASGSVGSYKPTKVDLPHDKWHGEKELLSLQYEKCSSIVYIIYRSIIFLY